MQILTFNYKWSMVVAGDSTCFLQLDVSPCLLALGTKPSQLNQMQYYNGFFKALVVQPCTANPKWLRQ
jgi:hypothetical protein